MNSMQVLRRHWVSAHQSQQLPFSQAPRPSQSRRRT
jgi:hypothetical protein